MRIVLSSLADLTSATADAITTLRTARALSEAGHVVTVLAPRQGGGALALEPGAATVVLHPNIRRWHLPNTLNSLVQLCLLGRLVRRTRSRCVYVRAATFTFLIGLWGRLHRNVMVVSEHHGWTAAERELRGGPRWLAAFERRCQVWDARLARRVRTVVPGIRDRLEACGVPAGRVVVVGNACDTELIVPIERSRALAAHDLDPDAVYLGFLGSLTGWQGLDDVLAALRLAREEAPALHLLVVGDGPLRDGLEARVAAGGLGGKVSFLGRIDHRAVPTALGCFDIALLPTAAGGYAEIGRAPLKLREYAAAGRVVLAARVPAVADLADEDWLELYEPGDVVGLGQALVRLASAPAALARQGRTARQYAETHFSWPVIIGRIGRELGLDAPATS